MPPTPARKADSAHWAKPRRRACEQSIQLDPAALSGSAYTSLGSLYYQVPGWPIGFGDDDKADEMLRKGLAFDPDGIANPGKMFPGAEAPALGHSGLHPLEKAGVICRE